MSKVRRAPCPRSIVYSALAFACVSAVNAAPIPQYSPWEQNFTWNTSGVANPWEDVTCTVILHSPKGRDLQVGGFYYEGNTYKVRFAPAEVGTYTWTSTITSGTTRRDSSGSFECSASTRGGFIRKDPDWSGTLTLDDGRPFPLLGLGDCTGGWNGDPMLNRAWYIEQRSAVSPHEYFQTYGDAGFNLFRVSVDNCSPELWSNISVTGNTYLADKAKDYDTIMHIMTDRGFHTIFAFWWQNITFPTNPTVEQYRAMKRYYKFCVDRYGAYTDIWELANEYHLDEPWCDTMAAYIRSIDPYKRLISVSWERPTYACIDINSPHKYYTESEFDADRRMATDINTDRSRAPSKPVIYGEHGNGTTNWDATSALRMRMRLWTAFMQQGYVIFWNTSSTKSYSSVAANMYLGAEERGYVRVLQNYTANARLGLRRTSLTLSDPANLRAHVLSSGSQVLAYMVNYTNHTSPTTGKTVTVNLQSSGTATWTSPATGATLGTSTVGSGQQTLAIPAFTTDIALRIELQTTVTHSSAPARAATAHRFASARSFDICGRLQSCAQADRASRVTIHEDGAQLKRVLRF